jgi:hypothetical protein
VSAAAELPDIASHLVAEAAEHGVALRLLGGLAVWHRASPAARAALGRAYPDLDMAAYRRQAKPLRQLLEAAGYAPDQMFNAVQGSERLLYHSPGANWHIDIFLDRFAMSHTLDLGQRLEVEALTLPGAELLLTKLQVAEVNNKDLSDSAMLLWDHELAAGDGDGRINVERVTALCGEDWGLFTTVGDNLDRLAERLEELVPQAADRERIAARASELRERLEAAPKSRRWRMRASVGRRKRWYETPEEH